MSDTARTPFSDPNDLPAPGDAPPRLSRRLVLGAAAAAGAAPLVAPGSAAGHAAVSAAAHAPAKAAAPTPPGPPQLIDPAFELSPPERPLAPWERRPLPGADARRLAPKAASRPDDSAAPSSRLAASSLPFTFAVHDFPVREVPLELWPYYRTRAVPVTDTGTHDSAGVRMSLRNGRLYNHPVAQAQYGLALLESYRITGNTVFLDRARQHGQRLWDTRVVRSNAWFYPYPFSFQLHGTAEVYNPPWYSMMAQGQVLSFFTRLQAVTGNANWATAAHNTFNSFKLGPAVRQPWGVYVVGGRLVLEEYPDPTRIHGDVTYNGHNFAAYGLHDYWSWTKNADALLLLQGAMTTTRDWSGSYRISGFRSKYCLTHATDSGHYHDIHIDQFAHLYAITGDAVFARTIDTYYNDSPPSAVAGTVRLAAGGHTGCKFDSKGRVTSTKLLRLNSPSSAPSTYREKIWSQPGLWYSISAGGLSGYKVQEKPPTRYQLGRFAGVSYLVNRSARIAYNAPKAYVVDAAGSSTSEVTTYRAGDTVLIDSRAALNASQHVRLADGPYVGKWLPLPAITFS
ncbi:D-glucuronyl C5-epimerase family protein [Actinoplanes sp. NPDC051633]|uniref:D-glucuronyl C5-epimerase family protein n=1 Tax=Actinoplanes sp. NPDC051633 TaxID=3155670 RepID=UPI003434509E